MPKPDLSPLVLGMFVSFRKKARSSKPVGGVAGIVRGILPAHVSPLHGCRPEHGRGGVCRQDRRRTRRASARFRRTRRVVGMVWNARHACSLAADPATWRVHVGFVQLLPGMVDRRRDGQRQNARVDQFDALAGVEKLPDLGRNLHRRQRSVLGDAVGNVPPPRTRTGFDFVEGSTGRRARRLEAGAHV